MSRIGTLLIIVLVSCLVAGGLIAARWKTIALDAAEKAFRSVLKGYSVSIGGREISTRMLAFRDIDIRNKGQQILKAGEVRFDFTLLSLYSERRADFSVRDVTVIDKLKIDRASGLARFERGVLAIGNISVMVLGGVIEGGALIKPGRQASSSVALDVKGVRLEKLIETFKLGEKLDLTGSVSGAIRLSGEGASLMSLKGKLETSPEGGTLTINDKKWLDAIAKYAGQDVGVIVESFRNYRYNIGKADLKLEGSAVVMDVHLEGDAGKRDLVVALHDFI